MNCVECSFEHQCRAQLKSCPPTRVKKEDLLEAYQKPEVSDVVKSAAELVDHGRAGTLNRLEEVMEYCKTFGYEKIGLAYCYGMEKDAGKVAEILRNSNFKVSAASCTIGALAQNEINDESDLPGVSCNPIAQGRQLAIEKVDFVLAMGLCMGHDFLLQQQLNVPVSVLVVKDRTSEHNPLAAIRKMHKLQLELEKV